MKRQIVEMQHYIIWYENKHTGEDDYRIISARDQEEAESTARKLFKSDDILSVEPYEP